MFLDVKSKVKIEDFSFVASKWQGRQTYIYKIRNDSRYYLTQIKVNHEFLRNGKLVNVENKWLSEIRILAPDESMAMRGEYSFPNGTEEADYHKFEVDSVNILVTGFNIKKNVDADKTKEDR